MIEDDCEHHHHRCLSNIVQHQQRKSRYIFLDASRPPKVIYIIHTQKVVQTSPLLRSEEKWKTTVSQNLFGVSKKTLGVTK